MHKNDTTLLRKDALNGVSGEDVGSIGWFGGFVESPTDVKSVETTKTLGFLGQNQWATTASIAARKDDTERLT